MPKGAEERICRSASSHSEILSVISPALCKLFLHNNICKTSAIPIPTVPFLIPAGRYGRSLSSNSMTTEEDEPFFHSYGMSPLRTWIKPQTIVSMLPVSISLHCGLKKIIADAASSLACADG
jgi:hypothetical protein